MSRFNRSSLSQQLYWSSIESSKKKLSFGDDINDVLSCKTKQSFQDSFLIYCHTLIDYFFAFFGLIFFGDRQLCRLICKITIWFSFSISAINISILIFWAIRGQFIFTMFPLFCFLVRILISISYCGKKKEILQLNKDMRTFWTGIAFTYKRKCFGLINSAI